MDAPKKSLPKQGGSVSWSAEAMLAAGIVAGSMIARTRNPRMALLLAAGALAWRAMKPKQRPAPMLALPTERLPDVSLQTWREAAPQYIIEATPFVEEAATPVVAEVIANEKIEEEPAPPPLLVVEAFSVPPQQIVEATPVVEETAAPVEPEAHTRQEIEEVPAPPAFLVVEASAPEGEPPANEPPLPGNAWILGLEPLLIVEELPEQPAYLPRALGPTVHEHKPMIAEGAPLPDMIEISLEPALAGLQMSMAPVPAEPRPFVINEGPVAPSSPFMLAEPPPPVPTVPPPAPGPFARMPGVPPTMLPVKPVSTPKNPFFHTPKPFQPEATTPALASPEAAALELFGAPAAPSLSPFAPPPERAPQGPAATDWAGSEAKSAKPGLPERQEPVAPRPTRRLLPVAGGEVNLGPRRNPVFGLPLPLHNAAEASNPTPEAADQPRRIVPRAPASSTNLTEDQKSWLAWWK